MLRASLASEATSFDDKACSELVPAIRCGLTLGALAGRAAVAVIFAAGAQQNREHAPEVADEASLRLVRGIQGQGC